MFFFRLLQKLAHNLYTPHTLAERFKDPATWTTGLRMAGGSITFQFDAVGGIAGSFTRHTPLQLPRLVALHQRLTSMRYWYALNTSITLLSIIFFFPKEGYAVPKVCDWAPSFVQAGCRSSLSAIDRFLELSTIPTVVIAKLGAIPGQYVGLIIFAVLSVLEPFYYLWPFFLLAVIWINVYSELFKAFFPSLLQKHPKTFVNLLHRQCVEASRRDAEFVGLRDQLNALSSELQFSLSSLANLDEPWKRTLGASDLLVTQNSLWDRSQGGRPSIYREVQSDLAESAFTSLANILDDALAARDPSPDIRPLSLHHRVSELTGIFIKFLLPFPRLKHLARPLRLKAFLLFVLPQPILRYLTPRPTSFDLMTMTEADGEQTILALFYPLPDSLIAMQTAGISAPQVGKLFNLYLRLLDMRSKAVSAEDEAHEAVLEAVLLWKERKNELEQKRFKQE